ncbi:MAG: tyrosine-type recombinase/integrase [Candidatus Omnitrophota bacterium]
MERLAFEYSRSVLGHISVVLYDMTTLYFEAEDEDALSAVERHPTSSYVFCYDDGQRVMDVRKSFCTALRKSGITNFHFHDLRHTFASQLVMAGVDLNTVRDGDITMTLRYAHLAPSYKQRAVDMLVDAL